MKGSLRAFTMVELLVVVTIIALLAAMLFPVLNQAKVAAKQAKCQSNFRMAAVSVNLYVNDYDDRVMPVNYIPAANPNSSNDRTWVQMILPYVGRSFDIFRCPADDNDRPRRETTFDQDLVPGDTYSQYYTASLRTNLGYNFIYFSPIYRAGSSWFSQPRMMTNVVHPSNTVMFVDSVWHRNADGTPSGGGSWLVVPPCRFEASTSLGRIDTFSANTNADYVFTDEADGWELDNHASRLQYGGAFPWHGKVMTIVRADTSTASVRPERLWEGCDFEPNWEGLIRDRSRYAWDLD